MPVPRPLTMAAQKPHAVVELRVIRDERATVAPSTQVLRWIEAEATEGRERSGPAAEAAGAVRLRRVLDDRHAGRATEGEDRLKFYRAAVQVDGDDQRVLGPMAASTTHRAGLGIDVREPGRRSDEAHRLGSRHERVRGHHDLIAGRASASGARITRLAVTVPGSSWIDARCRGARCPVRHVRRRARGGRETVVVRLRRLERQLPAGTRLVIRIGKADLVGRYVRFIIRGNRPPQRTDRCLPLGKRAPVRCSTL
jgi:hypothetical protein